MSEWRLLQLDFYNILAPAVTKVPEKDPDAETRPRIEPGDDEYLDLKIRALMHGFDEEVDPNDVAHLLEEEPIPLRSMRIPIRRNVSAGWAPNGYGKTYIFDYLERQTKRMNGIVEVPTDLEEAQRMNDDPLVAGARELTERYNTHEYYLQSKERYFTEEHWEFLFGNLQEHLDVASLNSALSNPPAGTESIASSFKELKFELAQKYGDGTLSGHSEDGEPMLYPEILKLKQFEESSHWSQEDFRLSTEHPNSKLVPYHCRGCLVEHTTSGNLFGILEFPTALSFDDRLQEEVPAVFFREIKTDEDQSDLIESGWSYSRINDWKELSYDWVQRTHVYPWQDGLESNLEHADHDDVRTWMDSFDVEYVEIPKLASKDRFPDFLAAQSSRLTTPYVFNSSRYQTLASNWKPLAPISQPGGLVREAGLLRVIEEIHDEVSLICDPNFIGNDEFGFEKRVSTIDALISELRDTREEWHTLGEALFDDDAQVWGREVKEIIGHLFAIRFTYSERPEFREKIYSLICEFFSFFLMPLVVPKSGRQGMNFVDAFRHVFDWMHVMIHFPYSQDMMDDLETLNVHTSAERTMISSSNTYVRMMGFCARHRRKKLLWEHDFLFSFGSDEAEDVIEHLGRQMELQFWNLQGKFPYDLLELEAGKELPGVDIVEEVFRALNIDFTFEDGVLVYPKENHFILSQELNRCLSPSNHAHNPWGVEASILFETNDVTDTSEPASILFHPVATDQMNTLRPEHLSFGMRSETVLQLKLSEYLTERRNGWHRSPDLLIIDEPEIGRSEYWTTMLIHRLRRLNNNSEATASNPCLSYRIVEMYLKTAHSPGTTPSCIGHHRARSDGHGTCIKSVAHQHIPTKTVPGSRHFRRLPCVRKRSQGHASLQHRSGSQSHVNP